MTTRHLSLGYNAERATLELLSHEVDGVRYVGAAGRRLDDALAASHDRELHDLLTDLATLVQSGRCSPGALIHARRTLYEIVGPISDPNGPDGLAGVDGAPPQPVPWPPQLQTVPDAVPDPGPVDADATEQHDPATEQLQQAMTGTRRRARKAADDG